MLNNWRDRSNEHYRKTKETSDLIANELYAGLLAEGYDETTASQILRMALIRHLEEGFGDKIMPRRAKHNEDRDEDR